MPMLASPQLIELQVVGDVDRVILHVGGIVYIKPHTDQTCMVTLDTKEVIQVAMTYDDLRKRLEEACFLVRVFKALPTQEGGEL
jgi:hypothetical protein